MTKVQQKKREKTLYAFFQSNQVALSDINLTYYTMMVGNLLRKVEVGLRKGNTTFPSHIKTKES